MGKKDTKGGITPLQKLMNTPDNKIPDDDHLDRPPVLTDKELDQAAKEVYEKHKNDKPVRPKSDELAAGTIEALNAIRKEAEE